MTLSELTGIFAEGDAITIGAFPDGEPFVALRGDIIILPTGDTVMATTLTPETAAEIAAGLVMIAQACCVDAKGQPDIKRQGAVRAKFGNRISQLSTADGAKKAMRDHAKRRPS